MPEQYKGILCIGDPHLAPRAPGFRKDDYPRAILDKLKWSIHYAREQSLLPVILGDLFHYPRDNANWMLVELLGLFMARVLCVAGNHDCNEDSLTPDDTLSVLAAAGGVYLLDQRGPWTGQIGNTLVMVGGTAWGQSIPKQFDWTDQDVPANSSTSRLAIWVAHHDVRFPGYEECGRFGCHEIPGVDLLINGHIHRPLEDVVCGKTTWINPGNISRVSRSDGSRQRKPSVLRIDIAERAWSKQIVEIPHAAFDDVFHPDATAPDMPLDDSLFIRGLAQLESIKTSGGAGLRAFLSDNLDQFDEPVAKEIRALAEEVLDGDKSE